MRLIEPLRITVDLHGMSWTKARRWSPSRAGGRARPPFGRVKRLRTYTRGLVR